ncbi:MAG TPA: hypothetical protein VFF73_38680 [Planctomycetota bacterium]|nr:hypothetical protein [Planctomycetota bacterium]
MRRFAPYIIIATLALSAPSVARAQEEPPQPEDNAAEYSAMFERGMDLLKANRFDDSIRAFKRCIELRPNDPVSSYNVACCYSRKKDVKNALDWLQKSIDRGFVDLAHMSRDTDLDNIRDEDGYKELMKKTRADILAKRPATQKFVAKKMDEKPAIVLYLHSDGQSVDEVAKKVAPLADELHCVVLVPSGRNVDAQGGAHWDTTAETCVVADVKAALKEFESDADKVVLVGELDGASHALKFATEQGWKHVVCGAGVYEKVEPEKAKGLRAWFFAPRAFERALSAAQDARDDLLPLGAHVKVERHEGEHAFPDDLVPNLAKGVRWTLEQDASAAKGELKKF